MRSITHLNYPTPTRLALWATLSCTLAALVTYALAPVILTGWQPYPEFIAGLITFDDYYKVGEQRLFLVGLGLSIAGLVVAGLFGGVAREAQSSELNSFRDITLIVGIAALSSCIIRHTPSPMFLAFGGLSLVAAVMIRSERGRTVASAGACALFLSYGSVIGVGVLLQTLAILPRNSQHLLPHLAVAFMFASTLLAVCFEYSSRRTHLGALLLGLQLPIAAIPLRYTTLSVSGPQGTLPSTANALLVGLCVALLLLACIQLTRRAMQLGVDKWTLEKLIPVSTLFCIGFLFAFSFPHVSPLIVDEFHLGEMALPWHQIVEHGRAAYEEFVPVQGLIGLTIGFVNWAFFDGSLASFPAASALTSAIFGGAIILVASNTLGIAAAVCLAPVALPFLDRFYLLPVAFLMLAHPSLMGRPHRWLLAAVAIGVPSLFWNAPSAVVMACSTALAYVAILFRGANRGQILRAPLPAICLLLGLALFLPVSGVVRFVWENGYINTVQHASKIFESWETNPHFLNYFDSVRANRLAWEVIRIGGWMLGVVALVSILLASLRHRTERSWPGLVLLAGGGILTGVLLFPYSMGRVDPPLHLSRVGTVSMLFLAFFLPATFFYGTRYLKRSLFPPALVGLALGAPLAMRGTMFEDLLVMPTVFMTAPPDFRLIEGTAERFPRLGSAYLPPVSVNSLDSFGAALNRVRIKNESYVDLTNHSIYFHLLDLPSLGLYPSANAVGTRIQRRMIQQFEQTPPHIVWVSPMIEIDRAPIPLRNYLLYRWFIDQGYQLVEINGYGFLISPERFRMRGLTGSTNDQWRRVFVKGDLQRLPRAWGRSLSTLRPLVREDTVATTRSGPAGVRFDREQWITSLSSRSSFELLFPSDYEARGSDVLLLRLEQRPKGRGPTRIGVSLLDDPSTQPILEFTPSSGPLLVPIGTDPRWLREPQRGVRIHLIGDSPGNSWRIKNMSLMWLTPSGSRDAR